MKNVCIVGWGAIAPIHAYALKDCKNAHFYAVCDINPDKIAKCKKDFDVDVAYSDFDEMLKDETIDSVHICTPHYLHCEMIKKALAAGKKVVSEKPIAMTKEEFLSIYNEDFCVIIQNRYNPCIKKLKELVLSEKYGKIKSAKGILTWNRDEEYYKSSGWRGKFKTEGGGVLINQAVHTFDFLCYLSGGVSSVEAYSANYSLKGVIEVEDTVLAHLKLQNGANAIFLATNAYSTDSHPFVEIEFENACARYMDRILYINGQQIEKDYTDEPGKACWGNGHAEQIMKFYDYNEYLVPKDIENTMLSLFAVYESANTGKEVII